MRVFADTSAFVALVARKDRHHGAARDFLEGFRGRLVTSTYVFDEAITRTRSVLGHANAVALGRALLASDLAHILPVEAKDLEAAWSLFCRMEDQHLSFTDCTIASMAQRLGVDAVFTFDAGFQKIGLRSVP